MIGVYITKFSGIPADSWLVVTICVIMCAQIYVGDILQKSYLRFLGTLFGCLLGAFVLLAFGATNVSIVVTIAFATFVFSYIATGSERISNVGTLGALTIVIVMLNNEPSLKATGTRFLEICAGIIIATVVSRYILPIHASDHIIHAQSETLEKLHDYYFNTIVTHDPKLLPFDYYGIDEGIGIALSAQRQMAKSASKTWFEPTFDRKGFLESIYCEKEILRAINFMYNALEGLGDTRKPFLDLRALHQFHETILYSLKSLIDFPETNCVTSILSISTFIELKENVQKYDTQFSKEELFYVEGFLFSAEILVKNLIRLSNFYKTTS